MSRKVFILSHGATCKNWNWSWSFINPAKRFIIFGAWDVHTEGAKSLILDEEWEFNDSGSRNSGYPQSREHIRLIEEESYQLFTFQIIFGGFKITESGNKTSKIKGFEPRLTPSTLLRVGRSWYATGEQQEPKLPEEITKPEFHIEGAKRTITVNAYERCAKARAACINHHGTSCAVCAFSFKDRYGELGSGFIHVHHIVPIGSIGAEYQVDPINDMVPVCPNCHAMLHQTEPPLKVSDLKELLKV